jgi:hypothetical protein
LEVRLRMSFRSEYNICRSLGNTPCPFWITGILVIEGAIPLSGQPYLV